MKYFRNKPHTLDHKCQCWSQNTENCILSLNSSKPFYWNQTEKCFEGSYWNCRA